MGDYINLKYDEKPNFIIPKYYHYGRIVYNEMNAQQSELVFDSDD